MPVSQPSGSAPAGETRGLVNEMRVLVTAAESVSGREDAETDERLTAIAVIVVLMLLLTVMIFASSALSDLLGRVPAIWPTG